MACTREAIAAVIERALAPGDPGPATGWESTLAC